MKNVLDRFEEIVQKAYSANKQIQANNYEGSTGYGPRFRKMLHKEGKRGPTPKGGSFGTYWKPRKK